MLWKAGMAYPLTMLYGHFPYIPDHRVDIGEYRIIYNVDGNVLKVFLIGKRNDDESYRTLRLRQ